MELIDKQKRYYTAEKLAELQHDFQSVPVDGEGYTIPGEYDERFVRGTVLKLIADLHSSQEEIAKLSRERDELSDKLEYKHMYAKQLEEEKMFLKADKIRSEARAIQAEQERDALLDILNRMDALVDFGEPIEPGEEFYDPSGINQVYSDARSIIAKIEGKLKSKKT